MSNWVRSRRCETNTCVEVRAAGGVVEVRDSKNPDSPVLQFTPEEWRTFLAGVFDGDFDNLTRNLTQTTPGAGA